VPVKAPLPEKAILKRNQAAVDRRRAERKERHNEKELTKHDWNDNCIKCHKACRAYSPGTNARKEEDGLLLEFPCNPTRTRSV
jgi:hypothetical protein